VAQRAKAAMAGDKDMVMAVDWTRRILAADSTTRPAVESG
jgi:hypothetical protein